MIYLQLLPAVERPRLGSQAPCFLFRRTRAPASEFNGKVPRNRPWWNPRTVTPSFLSNTFSTLPRLPCRLYTASRYEQSCRRPLTNLDGPRLAALSSRSGGTGRADTFEDSPAYRSGSRRKRPTRIRMHWGVCSVCFRRRESLRLETVHGRTRQPRASCDRIIRSR